MKILFVSGLYPHEYINILKNNSNGMIQNASNVFQWALVEGLHKNKANFTVVSLPFLPAYPMKYKKLFSPTCSIIHEEQKVGDVLSYCNIMVYKTYSMKVQLKNYILNWVNKNNRVNEKLVILTYTPYFPFIEAAKSVKEIYPNLTIASIVTDLVDDMMNFKSNRTLLKRIQSQFECRKTKQLYKHIDKFILLSKHMVERIPESIDKHIIVEGISEEKKLYLKAKQDKSKELLYTGTLEEFSGVRQLIQAFQKVENKSCKLIICGSGPLENMIKEAMQEDKRIIYKGMVSRDEALNLQKNATILINPRKPEGSITRFSFPSKTMEYMTSGTPMIGYKLEGIPDEYYQYYYTVNENTEESMIKTIEDVLALPEIELHKKAENAFNFIMNNKTSKIQIQRIMEFLYS